MGFIKIIIMVTWFGLHVSQRIESDNEIFMVGNKRCITNGSAALAIIKKINDTDKSHDNKNSSYYPTSKSICTFENRSKCRRIDSWETDGWVIVEAMDGPVEQYVTDRRWEDFPIKQITGESKVHLQVLRINNFKIFKIPLSVRIEKNAFVQMFLCDQKVRTPYNCYCITLAATESSIWKCEDWYDIGKTNRSSTPCRLLNNGHVEKHFEVSSEDDWTHLSIARKDNKFQVLEGNNVIMTYFDDEPIIYDTKSLSVNSRASSLWKVHDYHYLFSETLSDGISSQIGPNMRISKNTTCISMFVAMCKTCCLKFEINLGLVDILEVFSSQNENWTEEKIIIDTRDYVGDFLSINHYKYQCVGNSSQGLFWALDDIRLCEEKDYRYIESDDEKFTCQKIGIEKNEILKINDTKISKKGVDCPENTFGKFCVPCSMFGKNHCDNFAYCDKDHSEQVCHYTAGNVGSKSLPAPEPTYGISLLWNEKNDLNISWYHPNVTNSSLTSFEIILKNTGGIISPPMVYFVYVSEANYSLTYTKTVAAANLQACTIYEASIRAHSVYAPSIFSNSSATSPPNIPPKIPTENLGSETTYSTITVHVPIVKSDTATVCDTIIYILVCKPAEADDLMPFENILILTGSTVEMKNSWIVYSNKMNSFLDLTIGNIDQSASGYKNPPLEPGTNYSISIIMRNSCFGTDRWSRTQKYVSTLEKMDLDINAGVLLKRTGQYAVLCALTVLFLIP